MPYEFLKPAAHEAAVHMKHNYSPGKLPGAMIMFWLTRRPAVSQLQMPSFIWCVLMGEWLSANITRGNVADTMGWNVRFIILVFSCIPAFLITTKSSKFEKE